jgi:signal transduction histidine kinase
MVSVPSRRARWPWAVLAFGILAGACGMAMVVLNGDSVAGDVVNFTAFMGMGVVGALTLSRDRRNRIGTLLLWTAVIVAVAFVSSELATYLGEHGRLEAAAWAAWPGGTFWVVGIFPMLILLPLWFPDGRLPSPRWRIVPWAGLALIVVSFLALGFAEPSLDVVERSDGTFLRAPNPVHIPLLEPLGIVAGVAWPLLLGLIVASAAAMVVRFRRSSGTERQQLKWFAFAAVFLVVYLLTSSVLEIFGIAEGSAGEVISGLAFLGLPVAVGIALLRYRLWDLDVVVKKTVVAGTLVALSLVVYGVVVVAIPSALDVENPVFLFGTALALGIAFRPVMRIARRLADRLVYGTRATPYEVLTDFSERVGTSYATEDVLPRMAQVLGQGMGADVARIWLRVGSSFRLAAVWPPGAGETVPARSGDELVVPGETVTEVRDQGEVLGALSVRMPASDPMTPSKEKLARDLASQAGLVLRNVRLVEDLRASRQRLVAAQDEERRRLERNIHDGAQQQLVALAVKARLAKQFTDRDPDKVAQLLGQIEAETQTALEDLRDLARGIYPPLLADRGLVAAIEAQSRKGGLGVEVDAAGLGRFPADVEATVYFCALEALQNVAKYAEAARTVVHLGRSNGELSFEVVDDGRGFDPALVANGSGLQGMADRLAAVGGSLEVRSAPGRGTTVAGRVPVGAGPSSD